MKGIKSEIGNTNLTQKSLYNMIKKLQKKKTAGDSIHAPGGKLSWFLKMGGGLRVTMYIIQDTVESNKDNEAFTYYKNNEVGVDLKV